MRDGLQVLLQTEVADSYRCEGFVGLAIARPAQLIVRGLSSAQEALAQQLSQALRAALLRIHPQVRSRPVRCGGLIPLPEVCHAFSEPECIKVFVLVGDGTGGVSAGDPIVSSANGAHPHKVIVLLPRQASHSLLGPFSHYQAQRYDSSVTEAVPSILAAAELVSEERRIFISYRRREASGLAEQLFDALGRENYQVFLDSFSMSPGVDFHARLHQELADKALVLILESRHLSKSEWVEYEINFARAHRLGLLALHLPFGQTRPEIHDSLRYPLSPWKFWRPGRGKTLWPGPLAQVVGWISEQHQLFMARRRYQLRQAMRKALLLKGMPATLDPAGLLQVSRAGRDYRIWLTPRIPEPQDFHHAYRALQLSEQGVVIGPGAAWNPEFADLLRWVEDVSKVRHFDEGHIRRVAAHIQKGAL